MSSVLGFPAFAGLAIFILGAITAADHAVHLAGEG